MKRRIDILGVDWKVLMRTGKTDKRIEDADGWTDFDKNEIVIDKTIPKDSQYSVFLHEIIHVIDRQLALNLSESRTLQLEGGLFQVVNSNKLKFFD